ncbi:MULTISPECIES: DUF5405 family protein [unclassified Serratia (in: enterobacteria)]|uniref:DUF5405 family protein n=1 Tax=unclassified Serratia (in: enterobacteria) TaxID=2647522 RepID=UPI000469B781|nr:MULTISPECIES: DUF5405 family protein [unclassified Serratia (in: enterobacteria)]
MEIRIDKNWVITSDTFQFILNRRKTVKSGKDVGKEWLDAIGYYPTIPQLVSGLIHQGIRDSDVANFAELAAEVERIGLLCQEDFKAQGGGR